MSTTLQKTTLVSLYEGTFSVGLDKKFVRIGKKDAPAKGALKISLNPFLIRNESRNILIDAGIGEFGEQTGPFIMRENLESNGLQDYEITDVFLSHLHYDHIGGLAHRETGYWQLTFEEAQIWVSRKGWEAVMKKEMWYDEEKTEFIHFLNAQSNICFMGDTDNPIPEISVKTIGGHTPFHYAVYYHDNYLKALMAGDVLATRGQVNRKFEAKYDFEPKRSQKMREELAKQAYEESLIILGYHDDEHPMFKISGYDEKSGYHIEPV